MRSSRLIYLLLGLLTLLVLVPGIWEPTGLSGKDEYFLGLRTPMEMMARQEWLVPFLDGVPRLRKPPFLYWLGRANYEVFGVSLTSARIITVLFSALLVISTAGIARRLLPNPKHSWLAAGVLLSCLGLHTEGRRFMLDIPVTALSSAAFWLWLNWRALGKTRWLSLSTLALAVGFMIKGPVVFLVFFGGVAATFKSEQRKELTTPPVSSLRVVLLITGHLILLALLCSPWFFAVKALYPDAVEAVVNDEVGSRQFLSLTPGIVFGLLNISLPWFFVFCAVIYKYRNLPAIAKPLMLWFAITFIPFLFFKSFDRYLLGSLVPVSLLIALLLESPNRRPIWAFRSGLVSALFIGIGLAGFAAWFKLSGWAWLIIPAFYFGWAWFKPNKRAVVHLFAAPALYWTAVLGAVFPGIGVGSIPSEIIRNAEKNPVAFYDGPQPAMLAILSAQPHRHYPKLSVEDFNQLKGTPIFAEEMAFPRLFQDAERAGVSINESNCFLTLASHGSGIRFTKPNTSTTEWKLAFASRDLSVLKTRICSFQIAPAGHVR